MANLKYNNIFGLQKGAKCKWRVQSYNRIEICCNGKWYGFYNKCCFKFTFLEKLKFMFINFVFKKVNKSNYIFKTKFFQKFN